jgi:hypothetical protein
VSNAASIGFITTRVDKATYGPTWYITPEGLDFLWSKVFAS